MLLSYPVSLHRLRLVVLGVCAFWGGSAPIALASVLLSDSAGDPAYSDGWQHGDNGGFGLGPWIGAGTLGAASGNGADILPTIDTSGVSWSLEAGSSGIRRPLDAVVGVGVTLSMRLDVGANDFFGVAVSVSSESDSARLFIQNEGFFSAGTGSFGGNGVGLGVSSSDPDGVIVRFTLLQESVGVTPGRVRIGVQPVDGTEVAEELSFMGSRFLAVDIRNPALPGEGPPLYFNSLEATQVPEPAPIGWITGLGLGWLALVRGRPPRR